jgi:heme oxygenase (biliverdin-IX-beta and delta-forming)
MTFDIFRRLKEETADAHTRVEQRVPVFRPEFDIRAYGELLERFYGFWAPLESKLLQLPGLDDAELDLESRRKTSLLEQDLRFLGRDPSAVERCVGLPVSDTFLRGLGCMYVTEGSTLGSRFISRRLEEHLQLRAASGASFFNAYGGSVGQRWTEFKTFAAAHIKKEQGDEVVIAAQDTFERLYVWLGANAH